MPAERTDMRKIKEVIRLKWVNQLSERQIAKSCDLSRSTVSEYITRAKAAKLNWPLPEGMDDEQLEHYLFPVKDPTQRLPQPDWKEVHQELKKKGVTLLLLWQEYQAVYKPGMSYSHFCDHYRAYKSGLEPVMRQTHKAGEKLFVDYAGVTVPYTDAKTGEIHEAQIFVAVLGASNYTYIEATLSQSLSDWIDAHVRAFHFLGGVPAIVVPDNLRSGVNKAHLYDPEINPSYQELANHYSVAIVPARVRKPQDKAKVEVGVQGIERHILAPLRHHKFFSLYEINTALRELLTAYNKKSFQQMPGSRLSTFLEIDKPALNPLPAQRYEYAEWKKVRAGIDYHIAFDGHYYSVPHQYLKQPLDLRFTATQLTCFYKSKLIAVHRRVYRKGHTTVHEHMPPAHQKQAEWTPERLAQWAGKIGGATEQFIEALIAARAQPQQAFRACLGVFRLGERFGAERLEKAAARALSINTLSYKSIESILKQGLEQQPLPTTMTEASTSVPLPHHDNIRGAGYYHSR